MSTPLQQRFANTEPWSLDDAERDKDEAKRKFDEAYTLIAAFQRAREQYELAKDYASDVNLTTSERNRWRHRQRNYGRKYFDMRRKLRSFGLLESAELMSFRL